MLRNNKSHNFFIIFAKQINPENHYYLIKSVFLELY